MQIVIEIDETTAVDDETAFELVLTAIHKLQVLFIIIHILTKCLSSDEKCGNYG